MSDDVDLLADPITADLTEQLEARAPRRYVSRITLVLAGLVLVTAGFFAGAQVQKNFGPAPAATTPVFPTGARPQRSAAPAGPGTTTGTVKLVDGSTVYVQTADGTVVTVRTNGSTAVQLTQAGTLTDLTPGTPVTVEGQPAGQDTVTATKVTRGR
jgi:hypothetical protein